MCTRGAAFDRHRGRSRWRLPPSELPIHRHGGVACLPEQLDHLDSALARQTCGGAGNRRKYRGCRTLCQLRPRQKEGLRHRLCLASWPYEEAKASAPPGAGFSASPSEKTTACKKACQLSAAAGHTSVKCYRPRCLRLGPAPPRHRGRPRKRPAHRLAEARAPEGRRSVGRPAIPAQEPLARREGADVSAGVEDVAAVAVAEGGAAADPRGALERVGNAVIVPVMDPRPCVGGRTGGGQAWGALSRGWAAPRPRDQPPPWGPPDRGIESWPESHFPWPGARGHLGWLEASSEATGDGSLRVRPLRPSTPLPFS